MSTYDNDDWLPPEPGKETKKRFVKAWDTVHGDDEVRADPDPWKKNDIVAGFLLEKRIGSGVTSSVYQARDIKTGRVYALKILLTRCEQTRRTSRLGFRWMQQLSDPSLVHIYDLLEIGHYDVYKMELVQGRQFHHYLRTTSRSDRDAIFSTATRLISDIGGALQKMHLAYRVHRDVKPDNVMLDEKGRFRLIDYGLVGGWDPESDPDAKRNYLAGTLSYMAPESISGQIYPPACDIYALGCMVLELIADRGKLPPVEEGRSLGQSVGDVRSFVPTDTPADLTDLLCDMLDPEPGNRPMAARLAQFGKDSLDQSDFTTVYSRTHLFGREKEMAIAEHWVQSVVDGRPTRLHISGESGIGKSWFLAELQRRIRTNRWFQVFDSVCLERAEVSLRVFDSIADEIARRYSRDDREPIHLELRHALILRQIFPSLRSVIVEPVISPEEEVEVRQTVALAQSESADRIADRVELSRLEALASGVALVDQMCNNGPLFLIIDDSQWADQDSINGLDKMLSDSKGNLGIISIGRSTDKFRKAADCEVCLDRFSDAEAIELLRSILCHGGFQWDLIALQRLAELGEGNPYRLTQLAACVRADGLVTWHVQLLGGPVEVEDIWERRLKHLSPEAKCAIEYIAVAGGPIGGDDLATVSGLEGKSDAAVRELIGYSLVQDNPPKREAIDIVHRRIRQCILQTMELPLLRQLHSRWADHVMQCDGPWHSARIAGHLLDADRIDAAVPYMLQAARDAEARFAPTESARWHQLVASHIVGDESAKHLLRSIDQYEEAGQPIEAAAACRSMLNQPSRPDDATDLAMRHRLTENLLHAGQMDEALVEINSLAALSSPASSVSDRPAIIKLLQTFRAVRQSPREQAGDEPSNSDENAPRLRTILHELYRPLLSIDSELAFDVLAKSQPSPLQQSTAKVSLRAAIDAAVLQCRNPGKRRRRAARWIDGSKLSESPLMQNGLAFRRFLACDWAGAVEPSQIAVGISGIDRSAHGFDEIQANVPLLWSLFWLGDINDLTRQSETLTQGAIDRNDQYTLRIVHAGLSSASSLAKDETITDHPRSATPSDWWRVIDGFAPVMRYIYEGRFDHAIRHIASIDSRQQKSYLKHVQLPRVLYRFFEATALLAAAMESPVRRGETVRRVEEICHSLDRERIAFASVSSQFLKAQAMEIDGKQEDCIKLYASTAEAADELRLTPIRLAAGDRIRLASGKKQSNELKRHLIQQGVVIPDKFARLYCGLG